jgi:hypothetical protein
MRRLLSVAGAATLLALAGPARADSGSAMTTAVTDVASSFDGDNKFDFRFRVRYDHLEQRAQLKRELAVPGADSIAILKDLRYSSRRDAVTLRTELGLYKDLMLHAELPIIIEESALYEYDQSLGNSCAYPPDPNPTCVNASNSTTIRDDIVPMNGYDATASGAPLSGNQVFKTVTRGARGGSGLDAFDTFNLGLTWGALSQARDRSKPNWVVGIEGHISFGTIKRFDRANPGANKGVSEGVHRFLVRTALSRRFRFFEPYWELWYLLPIARGDSLFIDYGRAQKTKNPQMEGGTRFGVEFVPYERKEKQYRLGIDLGMRVQAHFEGRGYSQAWEMLAGSPVLACNDTTASTNPACASTTPANPYQNQPFTGITTIENYATVGGYLQIGAQIGPYFRLRTGVQYQHDQSHFITGDDIGTPAADNPTGRVTNPTEFNPAYRAVIDQPGRRYYVDGVHLVNFFLWAQAMF